MKKCILDKIANIRRLVAALANGSMHPSTAATLLDVSHSAARNYLEALVQGGAALHDPCRRTHVCINPDHFAVQRYLDTLEEHRTQRRVSLCRSSSRHCINPGKSFLHVLPDDVKFPLIVSSQPAARDPLVAALFGTSHSAARIDERLQFDATAVNRKRRPCLAITHSVSPVT
jgi:hypothetical protein